MCVFVARWWLAYTLINNPSLVRLRRRGPRPDSVDPLLSSEEKEKSRFATETVLSSQQSSKILSATNCVEVGDSECGGTEMASRVSTGGGKGRTSIKSPLHDSQDCRA